jgi:hypothetical protein
MRTRDRVLLPHDAHSNSAEPTTKTVKAFLTSQHLMGIELRRTPGTPSFRCRGSGLRVAEPSGFPRIYACLEYQRRGRIVSLGVKIAKKWVAILPS